MIQSHWIQLSSDPNGGGAKPLPPLIRLDFGETLPAGSGPLIVWPDAAAAEPLALATNLLALVQQLQAPGSRGASEPLPPRPLWLVLEGNGAWTGVLAGFAQTTALGTPQLRWTRLHLPTDPRQQPRALDWNRLWPLADAEASLL